MRAYSLDLRRIVAAVAAGMSKHEAARVYQVSVMTVRQYLKLHAADRLPPQADPGPPAGDRVGGRGGAAGAGRGRPGRPRWRSRAAWAREHEVAVSRATMSRALGARGCGEKSR